MANVATAQRTTRYRVSSSANGTPEVWQVIRRRDDTVVAEAPSELAAFKEVVQLLEREVLEEGYRALAADEESESEAQEWMNAPLGKASA